MSKLDNTNISANDVAKVIDDYVIGNKAERNRAILKRRLIDGISYEKLAEEFDLSTKQIQNVIKKYEYKIFTHL